MNTNILPQKQIKLACLISLLLLSVASYPSRVQAQLAESPSSRVANAANLWEETFPDNGAPTGRREGGASRNNVARLRKVTNLHYCYFTSC